MMELLETVAKLGSAALICGLIGLNRDLHDKPTGMRTLAIVGVAAATATTLVSDDLDAASRVIQGLVTGIGFLGAGVIVHNKADGEIEGMTTAASIWVTTCLGAACGLGSWRLVLVASIVVGIVLVAGRQLKTVAAQAFGAPGVKDGVAAREGSPRSDGAQR